MRTKKIRKPVSYCVMLAACLLFCFCMVGCATQKNDAGTTTTVSAATTTTTPVTTLVKSHDMEGEYSLWSASYNEWFGMNYGIAEYGADPEEFPSVPRQRGAFEGCLCD